ncbi:sensor histidine kinase [Gaoshiqia sediminis]|uniref:histidine kinase n=1 Tax=Gaoshiqia sediminis TaxID=2986998 RepID=A0AA41YCJ1_9BACT|nr:HAMP domain-containing sensor histidine kinase [Gaoshiqia sediminis]MCW0483865.1 HAMP domain-containing histidine kinase [Gaoshiqia sediminis]
MVRTLAKISLVLLLIVALPMSFYLMREYSALTKNEQMVERVFSTQLESILFSVNQYSENVLGQWSQTLDHPLPPDDEMMHSLVENLLQNNPAILGIRFFEPDSQLVLAEFHRENHGGSFGDFPEAKQIAAMRDFLANNYQRLNASHSGELVQYCFLPKNKSGREACQLLVEPGTFIAQNLRAQVQQISQEIFYIQIRNKQTGQLMMHTGEAGEPTDSLQTAGMWYLPDYELGIRLKTKTIYELATERTRRDNYLILGMSLLVVLGFLFVLVNIRKEIKLAALKSEFVSNVSHEIRTPLALISMYAETLLLKRVKTEQKKEEYLLTIQQESIRLTDIVNRILNFSRLEKNRLAYTFETVDLNKLVPHILTSLQAHLHSGQVDCRFSSHTEPATVLADTEAVKDMLVNLIDNAIKYGADHDKKIEVRLLRKSKQIWVEVEDNGIGISAKNQRYVFDQFYRVTEGDLAHKAKGSGLGLNLVKRMMKAHGGSVAVRSKPGEGSTFILKFPMKK